MTGNFKDQMGERRGSLEWRPQPLQSSPHPRASKARQPLHTRPPTGQRAVTVVQGPEGLGPRSHRK